MLHHHRDRSHQANVITLPIMDGDLSILAKTSRGGFLHENTARIRMRQVLKGIYICMSKVLPIAISKARIYSMKEDGVITVAITDFGHVRALPQRRNKFLTQRINCNIDQGKRSDVGRIWYDFSPDARYLVHAILTDSQIDRLPARDALKLSWFTRS